MGGGAVRAVSGPEEALSESRPRRHPLQSLAQTGQTNRGVSMHWEALKLNLSVAILNRHSDIWWLERLPAQSHLVFTLKSIATWYLNSVTA